MSFIFEPMMYVREAQAQADAASYNAQTTQVEADAKETAQRQEIQRRLGSIRAGISKAGVTSEGTPMSVLAESAANAEIDALTTRWSAERGARLYLMQGEAALASGYLRAGTSLLKSASQASGGK